MIESILKYSSSLHVLHITDQKCYSAYSFVIKVGINIGETKESHEQAAKLVSLMINFID